MRSSNHCCRGKAISITYSECVCVTLVTRHANRLSSVPHYIAVFTNYLINDRIFAKIVIEHKNEF